MGPGDRDVGAVEHAGRDTVDAELQRFAVLLENLLQQILVTRVYEAFRVEAAFAPDRLHGRGIGNIEILGKIGLEQSQADCCGRPGSAAARGGLDEQVRRNAVGGRAELGFPAAERSGVFLIIRALPALGVFDELFKAATGLRTWTQQKTAPLE